MSILGTEILMFFLEREENMLTSKISINTCLKCKNYAILYTKEYYIMENGTRVQLHKEL